jgi:hypothetical protein
VLLVGVDEVPQVLVGLEHGVVGHEVVNALRGSNGL